MGKMADIHIGIIELHNDGIYTNEQIALMLCIPVSWVKSVIKQFINEGSVL